MKDIGSFFGKVKDSLLAGTIARQNILTSVCSSIYPDGVGPGKITLNDIQIKDTIVTIRTNPTVKNQIFIKKDLILKNIREKMPNLVITEIR